MIADLIRRYASENRQSLLENPKRLSTLQRLMTAERSKKELLASDPKICQAFVRLDRVASGEPVPLFGQPVPSHAFNRLTISFGQDEEAIGAREPGLPVFTGLLSEQSLTNLMMNQNRGESGAYVTGETAIGYDLGPIAQGATDPRESFDAQIERRLEEDDEAIGAAMDALRRAKLPLSRTAASDISTTIGCAARPGDIGFHVGAHHEVLGRRMLALQMEATHTAQSISRILAAREQLRLAPPEPRRARTVEEINVERQTNPMLDALTGPDETQQDALRVVLEWAIADHARSCGIEGYDGGSPVDYAKRFRIELRSNREVPDALTRAEALCRLHNEVSNEHILATGREMTPWTLMASATLVSGNQEGLHSDFSSLGGRFMRLTISRGHVSHDHGRPRLRDAGDLITLELAPEEFLQLLRGHPTGDHVRCTLRRFAGEPIPLVPYTGRYDAELARAEKIGETPEAVAFHKARTDIQQRIEAGVTSKAARDAILADLAELREDLAAMNGQRRMDASAAADSMETMVGGDLSQSMISIMESLGLEGEAGAGAREVLEGPH